MTVPTGSPGSGFPGSSQPAEEVLAEAARRIDDELNRRPSNPMAFSVKARERLEILHADYLRELSVEAVRIARRKGLETVGEKHVDEAYDRLGGPSRDSGIIAAANTVGSVVAGAGIASIYKVMFDAGYHSQVEILTALGLSIVGFVLLAVALTVLFVRR